MTKYVFRLDDISEYMDFNKFNTLKKIFFKYNIKPIIGVIPKNEEPRAIYSQHSRKELLKELELLRSKGWTIAQHGYTHRLDGNGGLLNINSFGEFGGLPFAKQLHKIKKGKNILNKDGFDSDIFIAPAHSFDNKTLKALKAEKFKIISDGIGLYPFSKKGMLFVPVIIWHARKFLLGDVTLCLHPNQIKEKEFHQIESFIRKNRKDITTFESIVKKYNKSRGFSKLYQSATNQIFRTLWFFVFNAYKINRKWAK